MPRNVDELQITCCWTSVTMLCCNVVPVITVLSLSRLCPLHKSHNQECFFVVKKSTPAKEW